MLGRGLELLAFVFAVLAAAGGGVYVVLYGLAQLSRRFSVDEELVIPKPIQKFGAADETLQRTAKERTARAEAKEKEAAAISSGGTPSPEDRVIKMASRR